MVLAVAPPSPVRPPGIHWQPTSLCSPPTAPPSNHPLTSTDEREKVQVCAEERGVPKWGVAGGGGVCPCNGQPVHGNQAQGRATKL